MQERAGSGVGTFRKVELRATGERVMNARVFSLGSVCD